MSAKHDLVTATLSSDDAYARENGWVEADGTLTTFGRGALLQFLYEQKKSDLVSAVKSARAKIVSTREANYKAEEPVAASRV